MTLTQMKEKVLTLIEEISPQSELLTDDPDIAAKLVHVIQQVMTELSRLKKLPRLITAPVKKGDILDFAALEALCGREIYQLGLITGVEYLLRAGGTVVQILSDGTAQVDVFVYPLPITGDDYEFELSRDVLEIMPYGIAADLLKTDLSADGGRIYAQRYADLLRLLDPRYQLPGVQIWGGAAL